MTEVKSIQVDHPVSFGSACCGVGFRMWLVFPAKTLGKRH